MYGVTGCSGHSMAVTGWLSLERRDQDPRLHACIFFDVFQGSTTLRLTGQSYLLCPPALPACCLSVCLSVLSTLSRLSICTVSSHAHILFQSSALSQRIRNTAQRIASHCIESLLVTVQCFFSLPLLSFVASVPGPVPVLILLFCLRHQHHDHRHHHINRSLVSPTTAAIHDPHSASSGSHVTEIA